MSIIICHSDGAERLKNPSDVLKNNYIVTSLRTNENKPWVLHFVQYVRVALILYY